MVTAVQLGRIKGVWCYLLTLRPRDMHVITNVFANQKNCQTLLLKPCRVPVGFGSSTEYKLIHLRIFQNHLAWTPCLYIRAQLFLPFAVCYVILVSFHFISPARCEGSPSTTRSEFSVSMPWRVLRGIFYFTHMGFRYFRTSGHSPKPPPWTVGTQLWYSMD